MKVKLLVLFILFAVMNSSYGSTKSGDIVKGSNIQAKTTVPENKMMIIAKVNVKPEKVKEFIEAAREMIEKSNKESGCSFYQLYQDPYDNSKFVFVEEYKNQSSVDAHFASDYFKGFGPKIGDLVSGPAEIKIITEAKEVIQ
jgi:quinol monooxygenase YgiN